MCQIELLGSFAADSQDSECEGSDTEGQQIHFVSEAAMYVLPFPPVWSQRLGLLETGMGIFWQFIDITIKQLIEDLIGRLIDNENNS